ncbi:hypothetical protein KIN20_003212 [Parelaphostrongylus tenuis]|uniref:Uncharacterized protein n=1 Tax=Parelaphostrongylus tenuis TaxID=148309 RepID=A0AAD5MHZ9_PARTN|nr:hypothetical protein KIN20_003212 [Parelaphostrongylus tenuis]
MARRRLPINAGPQGVKETVLCVEDEYPLAGQERPGRVFLGKRRTLVMKTTLENDRISGRVETSRKRPRLEPPPSAFVINSIYRNSAFAERFRADIKDKKPFPHWQLRDFLHVDPFVLERIEAELISYPSGNRKENDLYSLLQTPDLQTIDKAEHPAIAEFRYLSSRYLLCRIVF